MGEASSTMWWSKNVDVSPAQCGAWGVTRLTCTLLFGNIEYMTIKKFMDWCLLGSNNTLVVFFPRFYSNSVINRWQRKQSNIVFTVHTENLPQNYLQSSDVNWCTMDQLSAYVRSICACMSHECVRPMYSISFLVDNIKMISHIISRWKWFFKEFMLLPNAPISGIKF